jgi:hypothetical protein
MTKGRMDTRWVTDITFSVREDEPSLPGNHNAEGEETGCGQK